MIDTDEIRRKRAEGIASLPRDRDGTPYIANFYPDVDLPMPWKDADGNWLRVICFGDDYPTGWKEKMCPFFDKHLKGNDAHFICDWCGIGKHSVAFECWCNGQDLGAGLAVEDNRNAILNHPSFADEEAGRSVRTHSVENCGKRCIVCHPLTGTEKDPIIHLAAGSRRPLYRLYEYQTGEAFWGAEKAWEEDGIDPLFNLDSDSSLA